MKSTTAFIALPLALVLSGCPAPPPKWAEIPGPEPMTASVGELVAVPVLSVPHMGALHAPAPAPAKIASARCDDESVCEVTKNAPFRVAGKRAGKATLTVEYVHPFDGSHEQRRIPVTFEAAAVRELALGDDAPGCGHPNTTSDASKGAPVRCELKGFPLPNGQKADYLCDPLEGTSRGAVGEKLNLSDDARGTTRLFACRQKDSIPWEPREAGQDRLYVCEDVPLAVGAKSKALWVYRASGDKYAPALALVEKRGEARDVCSLR